MSIQEILKTKRGRNTRKLPPGMVPEMCVSSAPVARGEADEMSVEIPFLSSSLIRTGVFSTMPDCGSTCRNCSAVR